MLVVVNFIELVFGIWVFCCFLIGIIVFMSKF